MSVYVTLYGLFNDDVSVSVYIAQYKVIIQKQQ